MTGPGMSSAVRSGAARRSPIFGGRLDGVGRRRLVGDGQQLTSENVLLLGNQPSQRAGGGGAARLGADPLLHRRREDSLLHGVAVALLGCAHAAEEEATTSGNDECKTADQRGREDSGVDEHAGAQTSGRAI